MDGRRRARQWAKVAWKWAESLRAGDELVVVRAQDVLGARPGEEAGAVLRLVEHLEARCQTRRCAALARTGRRILARLEVER